MKPNFLFKAFSRLFSTAVILVFTHSAFAQTTPTLPDTSKMTYNQMSQGLKLYVYPAKGQSQQQQKEDEFECYKWAMEQSGVDPLNLPKVEAAPVQSGPTGGAVVGAAKGAAAGAAIGAITGDAGQGAAVGAAAGAMAGRRAGRRLRLSRTKRHKPTQLHRNRQLRTVSQKRSLSASKEKGTLLNNHD